jgi:hypothetical protein
VRGEGMPECVAINSRTHAEGVELWSRHPPRPANIVEVNEPIVPYHLCMNGPAAVVAMT